MRGRLASESKFGSSNRLGGLMPLVHLVIGLALVQFFFFLMAVGRARGTYKVPAPATTGNEVFERYFRVQMNTLELLVIFVPSIILFGAYISAPIAAALGVVYLIGRLIYFTSYVKDPKSRSVGYGLSALPVMALLAGSIIGAIRAAVLSL
jgi:glutathione S-transferase